MKCSWAGRIGRSIIMAGLAICRRRTPFLRANTTTSSRRRTWDTRVSSATTIRVSARNADIATGLPNAYQFYEIANDAKQSDQDIYMAGNASIMSFLTAGMGWFDMVWRASGKRRRSGHRRGSMSRMTGFILAIQVTITRRKWLCSQRAGDSELCRYISGNVRPCFQPRQFICADGLSVHAAPDGDCWVPF